MLSAFLQYLFSGLTTGAVYALAALGFAIIYNASHVINFAQGEFLMIGGMAAAAMVTAGVPMPVVQQHLGHESINTTISLYTHLDQRSMKAGADAIDQALRGE